jgi:hypothetical protein
MAEARITVLLWHCEPQTRVLNVAMNQGLRKDDGRDLGPCQVGFGPPRVGQHPWDDEKDAMRCLACTVAGAVA